MILSDKTILQEMEAGNIIISEFKREHLNPNSVDLTLAPLMKIYPKKYINVNSYNELPSYIKESSVQTASASFEYRYEKPLDPREKQDVIEFIIPDEGFVLVPNEVYLYACNERIGCKKNICAQVQAKSSLGRLGLDIVIGPAGFIDTGFEGSLVLELRATRPIIVYPNMKICQIKFERVEGDILESYDEKSGSKYMNQTGVQESLMHKNFNK
ncbi:MAG: dCTP deaminase [Candidatus Woesearchaeota archaeon]|nr:dCTP deaminase [Candidatus Woesearchaeota archaeon]